MSVVYEVGIRLIGMKTFERFVREYTVVKHDKKGKFYNCSRQGSIGVYTIYERALDSQLAYGNGFHFYTVDKKALKDYQTILDEHMEKYLDKAIKNLTKFKGQLGSPWGAEKKKKKIQTKDVPYND